MHILGGGSESEERAFEDGKISSSCDVYNDENVISCKALKNKKFKNFVTFIKNISERQFFRTVIWQFDFIIAYLNIFSVAAGGQRPLSCLCINMDKFSQFKKVRACNSKNPSSNCPFPPLTFPLRQMTWICDSLRM